MRAFILSSIACVTVACGFAPTSEGGCDACVVVPADAGSVPSVDAGAVVPLDAGLSTPLDAGIDRTPIVGPITAANEQWSWVNFPDSQCGNGVPTGIAINPSTASKDVLIYMQGGGACWEGITCFVIKSATNIEVGYTASDWSAEPYRNMPGFTRTVANNPFKNASFVFVPYCTGDVHSGNSTKVISGKTVQFRGAANVAAYLKRLKATFPQAERVFLAGSSAGAFGAQLNYPQVVEAFASAEVHVLADSGQMINPSGTLLKDWVDTWSLSVPSSCVDCLTDFPKYIDWLTAQYPTRRFALLAYSQDRVLRNFFAYQPAPYQAQTEALLTQRYEPRSNAKYFYLAGESHTMLASQFTLIAPGSNVALNDFITQWYSGSSAWANVKP